MLGKIIQKAKKVNIWHDKLFLVLVGLGVLINFAVWMVLALKIKPSVYPIPLHYNIYSGIDAIDLWYKSFVIPAFGFFLLFLNFVVSLAFYRREKFITHLLAVSNVVIQLLLLAASIVMIQEI
ncbi:MAG: hypothetical protein HQ530_03365 [Parcubacteria group bacterium]|nr:hypothetical protein [Parcubacteria group bacterium]